ncbi:MAG: DUF4058 family protein [Gemmataceae bacterium]|nr:DUF4058 family protein [Gemmataceae bacterium]
MPSPFPGMDPYLEHPFVWEDVHNTLIPALRVALQPEVRPLGYVVRIDHRVSVREDGGDELVGQPDVLVSRPKKPAAGRRRPAGGAAVATPVIAELPRRLETDRIPYLKVVDREDDRVVTVIELLSPSNKESGNDRVAFLDKRRALLASDANYVEIDLLRGYGRLPFRSLPAGAYYVMASRPADRPKVRVWPWGLRDPIPVVAVPLRAGEPEPALDLRGVLDRVYDDAGYEDHVYHRTPAPRLSAADAAWARGVLSGAGIKAAG